MSLDKMSHEEIVSMPLIKLTKLVLLTEKRPMKFSEIFEKVSELKGLSEADKSNKMSQFYTELNIDGSFVISGENTWGLKRWYRTQKKKAETPRIATLSKGDNVDEADIGTEESDLIEGNIDDTDEADLEEELKIDDSES